jgi:PTS system N-acetylgalactosamine-specific IIA component
MTSSDLPAPAARRAVVAGHGDFAAGLISAVQQIAGKGDAFVAVTSRDLGAAAIEVALRHSLEASAARVIFTDLPAGSCTIAARRVAHDVPGIVVVTGTNLSALLTWALGPDDGVAAVERAVERGRRAMVVLPDPSPKEGGGAH